jgi:hypothetical protein
MELTKSEKKIVRELIEIGLQREFDNGLSKAAEIIDIWKNHVKDNRESYHLLYKHIACFDKHIARRYDSMTGSSYLFVLAGQYADDVIVDSDLEHVPERIIQAIKMLANK